MPKKSFTLIELLAVIIIIGILATLGLSQYYPLKERALDKEAIANLKLIRAAERIYRMEINNYIACADTSAVNINLKLVIPTTGNPNWKYKVDNVSVATFTFTGKAQRNVTLGRVWCIDQDTEEPDQTGCSW